MTSISAASSSTTLTPLQKLQQELQAELASGKVATGDADTLSSALDAIDSSLQSDRAGQSGSTQSKPTDIKSKIEDLIDAQVSSGKLTSDQATELQGVFDAAFSGGAGGPRGAGGPPPGPPPSDSASTDSTDTTDSTDSTSDASTLLQKLLASLQESLAASSSSSYSASGSTSASKSSTSFSALLVDYTS